MKAIETHHCHGGTLNVYEHHSAVLNCDMRFSIFLPPQSHDNKVPLLTFLSGLTCTHENFTTKGGAYEMASKCGLAILAPDTSPRGDDVADDEAYDLGKGASFYLNATQDPWARHYQMETYITKELNDLVVENFLIDKDRQGISGHSMGGHGALILGLKYNDLYKSISAFSPIVAPAQVPWGQKAFDAYLGSDENEWHNHDTTALITQLNNRSDKPAILIDQGKNDDFLEAQLKPHLFEEACQHVHQKLTLRMQEGYDHSYFFIQSFIGDHIKHHSDILFQD